MRVNKWDLQQAKRKSRVLRMRCFLLGCSVWKGGHPKLCYHLNFSQIWKISSKMSSETRAGNFRSLKYFTWLYIFIYSYSQSKSLTELKQKSPILNLVSIQDLGMNPTLPHLFCFVAEDALLLHLSVSFSSLIFLTWHSFLGVYYLFTSSESLSVLNN